MSDIEPHEPNPTLPNYQDLMPKREKRSAEFELFGLLREQALAQRESETKRRLSINPTPTDEELSAGTYKEAIEPQCREAIFAMRRKGYDTVSSGFSFSNSQVVDIKGFRFNENTIRLLAGNGYFVYESSWFHLLGMHGILFRSKNANLDEIKKQWNKLANLLPDLGHPAPSCVKNIEEFHEYFRRVEPGLVRQQQNKGLRYKEIHRKL